MKKLIFALLFVMLAVPAYARGRGALTNQYASWLSVTSASTTMTFPFNTRDITLFNGSAIDVGVDIKGGSITDTFIQGTNNSVFILPANTEMSMKDHVTNAISFKSMGATASPISVLIGY